jgi:hypothetical protein
VEQEDCLAPLLLKETLDMPSLPKDSVLVIMKACANSITMAKHDLRTLTSTTSKASNVKLILLFVIQIWATLQSALEHLVMTNIISLILMAKRYMDQMVFQLEIKGETRLQDMAIITVKERKQLLQQLSRLDNMIRGWTTLFLKVPLI